MKNGLAALAAVFMAAGCAGTAPQDGAPAPPPPVYQQAPAPAPQGDVAAPGVSVATPTPAPPRDERGGDITVPGQVEQQVQPPRGDPRTALERMEDIRAWDRCVMRVQGVAESNPTRPIMDQPEELCSRELGMADRTAVPARRLDGRQR